MSLWDTITGAGRKNASAEQLRREEERRRAEEAAAERAAKELREREEAAKKVREITFKKGGLVRRGDGRATKGKTKGRYI